MAKFALESQQTPPSHSLQRTQQSVTLFASAKILALYCAAELSR